MKRKSFWLEIPAGSRNLENAESAIPAGDSAVLTASHNGAADAHKFVGIIRSERNALEPPVLSRDENVAAQIRIVELDAPREAFAPAEHGWTNINGHNFVRRNDNGVEKNSRLKLQPVGIHPVFLPQARWREARHVNRRFQAVHITLPSPRPNKHPAVCRDTASRP